MAGLTVGVVALPLAMAFGIASGVTPAAGIYTAIVGGFIVSLLGGSRIQIGGPTGAFVVIVANIIAQHGLSGLFMVTMMAGVILMVLAATGLGRAVKFIPRRFGSIPSGLPSVDVPTFRADLIIPPLPAALTVALLAAVETALGSWMPRPTCRRLRQSWSCVFGT